MTTLQLVFAIAAFSLIFWSCSEGLENRQYLPAAVVPVAQRKLLLYPSYYKPLYNQYQQTYYPQYTSSYYPQYNNGFVGGYQQQSLGQQIITGTSLGGYQQQSGGQQITAAGYQKPSALETQISPGTSLDLIGYYPNLNLDPVVGYHLKPHVNVVETVAADTLPANYVYGKKK